MRQYLNMMISSVADICLVLIGCLMTGLGMVMVFFLAMSALLVAGLGLLVAPLVAFAVRPRIEEMDTAAA